MPQRLDSLCPDRPCGSLAAREDMISHRFAQRADIGKVIVDESADWLHFFPLSESDQCGHGFLDRCQDRATKPKRSSRFPVTSTVGAKPSATSRRRHFFFAGCLVDGDVSVTTSW